MLHEWRQTVRELEGLGPAGFGKLHPTELLKRLTSTGGRVSGRMGG